jgi:hypothetical protein
MTTTDWDFRSSQPITPYHVYLLKPEQRGRVWWTGGSTYQAMTFNTPQDAQDELDRAFGDRLAYGNVRSQDGLQIAPLNDATFPTFWEIQEMNEARRRARKQDWKAKAKMEL